VERPPTLRPASRDDVPRLVEVVVGATPDRPRTRSDRSIAYELERRLLPTADVWVAERGGTVVGVVAVRDGTLLMLRVLREAQGSGVGRALVGRAIELAGPGLRAPVPSGDVQALAFLGARGFVWDETTEVDGIVVDVLRGPGPEPTWW
jgi:GNAT superfamily N-acetyltransferase